MWFKEFAKKITPNKGKIRKIRNKLPDGIRTLNNRGIENPSTYTLFREKWIEYIKNTVAQVAPNFTTGRMIRDYKDRYYNPQYDRTLKIKADNYKMALNKVDYKSKFTNTIKGKGEGFRSVNIIHFIIYNY